MHSPSTRRRSPAFVSTVGTSLALLSFAGCGDGGTDPDPDDAIASVTISPTSATVDIGATQQLQATVRNGRNEVVSASVSWLSDDDTRATVSSTGLVTGVDDGSVTITATAEGRNGEAAITVNDPNPPAVPGGLEVTALSDTEIRLDWSDDADNEEEYRIEREEVGAELVSGPQVSGPQAVFVPLVTLGPNTTTYTDTGLDPEASFRYRVQACNGNGCSELTSEVEATTFAALVITTTSLPDGALDVPYDQTLGHTGGDGPPAWDLAEGALPEGLELSVDGEISGTPTEHGTFDFTVRASGAGQSPTQELSITVTETIEAPEVSTTELPDGGVGAAYETQLEAIKGDAVYTWAVIDGALPDGVTLATDGTLSGTPSAAGSFTVTFEVTSAEMTGEAELEITIHPALTVATTALPDGVQGQDYVAPVEADGGDGVLTWSLEAGDLPAGLSLDAGGAISGVPEALETATFTVRVESGVGQVATQELSITVNEVLEVTTTALADAQVGVVYGETLLASGGDGNNTWSISEGALPAGLELEAGTGEIAGTPGEAGSFTFTVEVASGDGQTDEAELTLEVATSPVEITTVSLPDGVVNDDYDEQLEAGGGDGVDYVWQQTAGDLPTGLSLSAAGAISGTPTELGTFEFTVEVTSAEMTDDQTLEITIVPGTVEPVVIETVFLPVAYAGAAYAGTVEASGGDGGGFDFAIDAGALPDGLTLDDATGEIIGTPTTAGTAHFSVHVESGGSTASRVYMLTASGAPAGAFNVHLHNVAGVLPSAAVQTALNQAVAKWEDVVSGNLTDLSISVGGIPSTFCNGHAGPYNGRTVDDIEIFLDIAPIDGPGGILAQAGPCAITERNGRALPLLGITTFDSEDLLGLDATQLRAVVFHEFGHVVGIGTLWDFDPGDAGVPTNELITGKGTADPRYVGTSGVAEYQNLGGADPDIPVANTGGSGTRDGHWREATFDAEIMTGFSEGSGVAQPISIMTIGSVADLGYAVDLGAAEPYTLPALMPPGVVARDEGPAIGDIRMGPVAFIRPDGGVETVYLRPDEGGR